MVTVFRFSAPADLPGWSDSGGPEKDRRKHRKAFGRFDARLKLDGVTILVVEDHPDSRDMLRELVESFGASVAIARNGYEALGTALLRKPDLVLCDLVMPLMDGFAFVYRVRSHPTLANVPVIAVLALGSDADFK